MRTPRFSIAGLLGVVLVAAVGMAALRYASEAWAGAMFLLTCGVLALAVVGAACINHDSADAAYVARVRSAFYHDVSDAQFAAVANLLTPDEPIQAYTTPANVTVARRGSVPRTFIRCTGDRAIPIAVQDGMIADADAFTPANRFAQITLNTSHSSFVAAPADLVSALTSVAT